MASSSVVAPSFGRHAPQDRLDALDDEALRKGLRDIIVGAHLEAEQLVDLLVLRRQEDYRHRRLLANAAQKLHAVHARHLDVENAEIGGFFGQRFECRNAVSVGANLVALGLQRHPQRGEDVPLVVDECDGALFLHFFLSSPVAAAGCTPRRLWRLWRHGVAIVALRPMDARG